ncbi:2OG-Fe(II) oxygenase family protein [Methylotenera versatilis]|uniref:2OG-Fe(II) oxygenase n=1 Tax=Methylotenera versatilis (strain 301) TaxID=666681 RepID=D7DHU6_METV0|nr:2OG-Fe(II) oxygenase [Methylotenera versatilis]ADI29631.1 2OG-Fe(II) oxygenase [Methylotenera versatilis 301]
MINIETFINSKLNEYPYKWAFLENIFTQEDAKNLADQFPKDNYKEVSGYDGEKGYLYNARSLIHMGSKNISNENNLSFAWKHLANELLSDNFRELLGSFTEIDTKDLLLEVNVIEYGNGAYLGPHLDLKEKVLTMILYFNAHWDEEGGCLSILSTKNPEDSIKKISPKVGNASILVRSNNSWHEVTKVTKVTGNPRRSLNVIFHAPGSKSTMW